MTSAAAPLSAGSGNTDVSESSALAPLQSTSRSHVPTVSCLEAAPGVFLLTGEESRQCLQYSDYTNTVSYIMHARSREVESERTEIKFRGER